VLVPNWRMKVPRFNKLYRTNRLIGSFWVAKS
jgi:hypothetical protein